MKLKFNTKFDKKSNTVTVLKRDVYIYSFLFMMIGVLIMISIISYAPNSISNGWERMYITNSTEIHNLAINITHDCNESYMNELCYANAINHWLYRNIEYSDIGRNPFTESVDITLKTRNGVCRHKAQLGCSLAKSIGMSCRINSYRNIINDNHKAHEWFEIDISETDNDYIVVCDPTAYVKCDFMTVTMYMREYSKPVLG